MSCEKHVSCGTTCEGLDEMNDKLKTVQAQLKIATDALEAITLVRDMKFPTTLPLVEYCIGAAEIAQKKIQEMGK